MKIYKKIKNLTGHKINILSKDKGIIEIPPYSEKGNEIQSRIPNLEKAKEIVGYAEVENTKLPIIKHNYTDVINPPDINDTNTLYIVSAIVKNKFKEYEHIVSVEKPQKFPDRNVMYALGFRVNG